MATEEASSVPSEASNEGAESKSEGEMDEKAAEEESLRLKTLGNNELVAGHFLQAIKFYSEALDYTPTNAIVLSNRAQAYLKVENYGLAQSDATAAIESDPTYAKGFYRRASAHYALNKFKLARKDFKQVCKLKPKDRDARAKLAECEKAVREAAFADAIVSEQTVPLSSSFNPEDIAIDSSQYFGPHPGLEGVLTNMEEEEALFAPGKLPRKFCMDALEQFKSQKLIHKRYVARLLISCAKYFEELSSLMQIPIPEEAPEHDPSAKPRLTVCGDTHGQFYDVMNIFEINGHPSASNPYLFNGDFVDRGSFSVEVILAFLLFKIHDPTCIYLSRGNHETKNMNRIYGFEGEVRAKYDDKIFDLFLEVFGHLPLAATVGGKVFVTHGGLSTREDVMLEDIKKIKRGMEPPESGLMSDLLWSDPQPFPGKSPSKRGVGFSFGPDITEAFLKRNNLSLLVRSHEVKEEGYLVEHGGKTITVFSAPNYCDTMGNKGAFIHFDESLEPKFTKYDAVPHPPVRPMAYAAGLGGLM
ncbi:protein phosphatase PP1 [Seminavis robusta]|uniref:Serine/threonine-protein phosphatase T n=1 Tax=Seminavis robusta TaxID=568900 RepID=A0A9N8DLW2_9STRA|nr:protein phosphatase PP1 [Seminavis robusta]|eukprot:Sro151_g069240.1 protein phosphatase PP1 (529) ;mRNA; f:65268-67046